MTRGSTGHFWIQLEGGPYDLAHNVPLLRAAVEEIREFRKADPEEDIKPVLIKLDSTRDLRGTFYAPDDWKQKHRELANALEEQFKVKFRDNGNSFDSCF